MLAQKGGGLRLATARCDRRSVTGGDQAFDFGELGFGELAACSEVVEGFHRRAHSSVRRKFEV
jgi:hypothetical protein